MTCRSLTMNSCNMQPTMVDHVVELSRADTAAIPRQIFMANSPRGALQVWKIS